jgi:DNA-binding MarR family transcriptional regulator
MGEALRRRLGQVRFDTPHHEAVLNLLVAAAHLNDRLDTVCARHELTRGQYNVLRILCGAHPDGYARCDIARRLIERAPDVTRLIDRLERQGLAERLGSERDRRLSITRITRKGMRLLDRMKPDIDQAERRIGEHLSPEEAHELSRICERIYEDEERG